MPSIPLPSRIARVRSTTGRVGRWASRPIAVRRGVHVGYFAGYALMAAVAILAILGPR